PCGSAPSGPARRARARPSPRQAPSRTACASACREWRLRAPRPRTVLTWFNAAQMPAQVEELAEDKVKLTVDVPAGDMHHAVEHAASDLAASVRIPGFRKGKVPMPLLVQRVGRDRLYAEAVESHIGGWFWNAAARARVNPVAMPEYEYELPSSDREDWSFSATVQVQPELELLQRTAAELVDVDGRPAQEGDTVVVDLIADDGSAQRDYIVELGSGRLVEELENGVVGLEPGASREIAYELSDGGRR